VYQATQDNPDHSGNAGNVTGIVPTREHPENGYPVYPRRLARSNSNSPADFPAYPANVAVRQPALHR
jgi:hypothetical protein